MNPKVTIIIPFYNTDIKLFRDCLNSVNSQTCKNLEVIIINDGSTNSKSIKYAQRISKKYSYTLLTTENMGVSNARNLGLKKATGDFVFFLDSDDTIDPECIDELTEVAITQKYNVVFGGIKNSLTKQISFSKKHVKLDLSKDKEFIALNLEALCSQGVLIDSNLAKSQTFDINLKKCEDTDYILRLLANNKTTAYILGNGHYNYIQNSNSVMHDYCVEEIRKSAISRDQLSKTLQRLVKIDNNAKGYLKLLNLNATASALIFSNADYKTFSSELKKTYELLDYKKIPTKYILSLKERLSKRRMIQFVLLNKKHDFIYYQLGTIKSKHKDDSLISNNGGKS